MLKAARMSLETVDCIPACFYYRVFAATVKNEGNTHASTSGSGKDAHLNENIKLLCETK